MFKQGFVLIVSLICISSHSVAGNAAWIFAPNFSLTSPSPPMFTQENLPWVPGQATIYVAGAGADDEESELYEIGFRIKRPTSHIGGQLAIFSGNLGENEHGGIQFSLSYHTNTWPISAALGTGVLLAGAGEEHCNQHYNESTQQYEESKSNCVVDRTAIGIYPEFSIEMKVTSSFVIGAYSRRYFTSEDIERGYTVAGGYLGVVF